MDVKEIDLNKIKSEETLELYDKTKEFIDFLESQIEEVKGNDE